MEILYNCRVLQSGMNHSSPYDCSMDNMYWQNTGESIQAEGGTKWQLEKTENSTLQIKRLIQHPVHSHTTQLAVYVKPKPHHSVEHTTHLTLVTYLKAIEQGLELERVHKFTAQESEMESTEITSLTTKHHTDKKTETQSNKEMYTKQTRKCNL